MGVVWFFLGVLCGLWIAGFLHAAGDSDLEEALYWERWRQERERRGEHVKEKQK